MTSEELKKLGQTHNDTPEPKEVQDSAEAKYGFKTRYIDDNTAHIQDAFGHEVAFEFPLNNISFAQYDAFIQQMKNTDGPLPSINSIELMIHEPRTDLNKKYRLRTELKTEPSFATDNSRTSRSTWEEFAKKHSMTVDEILGMYFFARQQLYDRFKKRLRPDS